MKCYLYKTCSTCLTLVWLLSWVDASVSLEVSWSVELSTTDVTAIRLLSWKKIIKWRISIKGCKYKEYLFAVWVCTCVHCLVAGQVALVAKSCLAAVTLVRLVAVHLKHVLFQSFIFSELGVAFITKECAIFCSGEIMVIKFTLFLFALTVIAYSLVYYYYLPQLESEYSECSSAISSVRREPEVLEQISECCGDWEPQDEQFRRLR